MSAALDVALAGLAGAYAWGWRSARRARPEALSVWRLGAFLVGVVALWAAVASPLAQLDQGHLTGHMIQHLLIMTVAAPLLLLGEPARLFSPRWRPPLAARGWLSPHPVLCWFAGTLIVLVWHVPRVFEFGMRWHGFQHATFCAAGLLFWVPVIQPWPTVSRWPRWSIPLYLFLATLPCDGLSAFLAFCGRVVYPQYAALHAHCGGSPDGDLSRSSGAGESPTHALDEARVGAHAASAPITALEDQQRAGALMWFWVTFAYLVPAALVTIELLSPRERGTARPRESTI